MRAKTDDLRRGELRREAWRREESRERPIWNYLAQLGVAFAVVVAVGAGVVLIDSYAAFCYLANM
jgi:hypothetical protein